MPRVLFVVAAIVALVMAPRLPAQQPAAGSWWITSGRQTVVLDEALKRRATVELGESAFNPFYSPDGSTIAVVAIGAFKRHTGFLGGVEFWPEPGAMSSVALLKADTLEVIARPTVRFRPSFMRFTADSQRLVVVSDGQVSKDLERQILPAVTFIDTRDGKVIKEINLDSEPIGYRWNRDSGLLTLMCEGFRERGPALALVDTSSGSMKKVALPDKPLALRTPLDGDLRYAVFEKQVVPVTPAGDLLPAVSAGRDQLFFLPLPDGKRLLLSGKTGKDGRLLVVEGGQVAKTITGPPVTNVVFSSDLKRLILCGGKVARVLDAGTLEESGRLPIPEDFLDVMLDPPETSLYVHEGGNVTAVRVADGKQAGRFGIGSGWRKFGYSTSGYWERRGGRVGVAGRQDAEATSIDTMAFSPSGNHVFAFNSQARDITIVETKTFTSVGKVGMGEVGTRDFFWRMPGGKHLLALKNERAIVFDTEAGKVAADRKFENSLVRFSPSMAALVVRTTGGTVVYRVSPFEAAMDLGPECALSARALDDKDDGFVANGDARRFLLSSAKGVRLYDYDLKLLTEIEGLGSPDHLFFLGAPKGAAK